VSTPGVGPSRSFNSGPVTPTTKRDGNSNTEPATPRPAAEQSGTELRPGGTLVAHASSPDEMKKIGAALARFVRPGDIILLGGELGAGKTTLTQGLAAELGVSGPVTSPTFVLVHSYKTASGWDLLHADVWRLEHLSEVIDLALPELLEDGAAAVVEWGEMAAPALTPDWLQVSIGYDHDPGPAGPGPSTSGTSSPVQGPNVEAAPAGRRRLLFQSRGPSWGDRMMELSATLAGLSETRVGPAR
jgi:tRNA threonylcarbamoyladenosine biosynthesis protein TsaE